MSTSTFLYNWLINRKPLYIETKIKCDLDVLWAKTQLPEQHQQWDLRFSAIRYLPKKNESDPQQFSYATHIGFGLSLAGFGESVATKVGAKGESTSILKFWSDEKLSLIEQGAGYWKYIPEKFGIRFFTAYDYKTRWGILGELIDKFIFRPLMIWATAWSFDRLKNWVEKGVTPQQALLAQLVVFISSTVLAIVWIYQGLVPKLLFEDSGELQILKNLGWFVGRERDILKLVGLGEMAFGLAMFFVQKRMIHILNLIALVLLALSALVSTPALFVAPFNPFCLNFSMMALSMMALLHLKYIPLANNCTTRPRV